MYIRNTTGALILVLLVAVALTPHASATESCVLTLTSLPDEGMIRIDGQQKGTTPLAITLPCENHTIEVIKNGFEPFSTRILFQAGEHKAVLANLESRSNRGSVIISSQPAGGVLYIDGILQGTTPVQVDNLVYGQHTILIKEPGYQDFRGFVTAGPGGVFEYKEYLVPEPQTGFMGVSSTPDGAHVYLDGIFFGTTSTRLERVSAGNHTVVVQKEGYMNYTAGVRVPGGGSIQVSAELLKRPDSGTLVIDSAPSGAEFFLNGTFKAITPAVLEKVPHGVYFLQFQKRDYPVMNITFSLKGGETQEVFANLTNSTLDFTGRGQAYVKYSNASQFPPGMIDTTPSYDRTYTWYNNGHEATVRLRIPRDLYDHYNQSAPHNRGAANLSQFALSDQDRTYLHDLIGMLKDAGESKTFAARNDFRNVVAFVQSIGYADDTDPDTKQKTDYWQYPVETLADGKGDCEDHAILAAALLKEMGYDVALVLLDDPTKGHAAVAIACGNCNGYYYPVDGKKYFFLETTAYGSAPGIMDSYYEKVGADVIVL